MFNLVLVMLFGAFTFILPGRFDWDQIFLMIGCMVISFIGSCFPKKREVRNFYLYSACLWMVATLCMNFHYLNLYAAINVFLGVMALKTISERVDLDIDIKKLGMFLVIFSVITGIFLAVQKAGLDPIYQPAYEDIGGSFGKPWALGAFAAISVPFIIAYNPVFLVVLIPLFMFCHSSICVVAAILAFTWIYRHNRMVLVFLTLSIPSAYFLFHKDAIDIHRIEVWTNTWKYTKEAIVQGHGIGSWLHSGFAHQTNDRLFHWPWAHNEWYQHLYEQGIIGLGLISLWFIESFRRVRPELQAAIISISILSFFHPIIHWAKLTCLVIVVMALVSAEAEDKFISRGAYGR